MRKTSTTLIAIVTLLLSIGIVMLASTSSVRGSAAYQDPHYFLKRQLIWLLLALAMGYMVCHVDYHWWQKLIVPFSLLAVVLLVLVFVPGIGAKVGGSNRWLRLGPMSVQPSELAKIVTVAALSAWMAHIGRRSDYFREGLLYPVGGLGLVLLLLIGEPDFGTTLLVGAVGMILLFAGGTRISYLAVTGVLGVCAFVMAVMQDPVRIGRVLAFLMPEKYPATAYHLAQSKLAFINGGLTGVGLGQSIQKQFYLPEAHNDFILAIVGEELGFVATVAVLVLFVALVVCGVMISLRAPDIFGRLFAFGLTMMLGIQAAINIGVVTGCLPTKGLPLPFISYGGSSMIGSIISVCILLNIAHHAGREMAEKQQLGIKDRAHAF
jgi:cell division protein FtsW